MFSGVTEIEHSLKMGEKLTLKYVCSVFRTSKDFQYVTKQQVVRLLLCVVLGRREPYIQRFHFHEEGPYHIETSPLICIYKYIHIRSIWRQQLFRSLRAHQYSSD